MAKQQITVSKAYAEDGDSVDVASFVQQYVALLLAEREAARDIPFSTQQRASA